jgi:hypothetical protein
MTPSRTFVLITAGVIVGTAACARSGDLSQDSTSRTKMAEQPGAPPTSPDAPLMVRGTVVTASASEIVIKTDTGAVTVAISQPFHLYARAASDLSQVKSSTFIGVTTVKQPDGSERATEIHVFPEELRGVGEGSRMMTPSAASTPAGRMTNGSISASRMTNGSAAGSRMSNGSVSSTNGTTLVVQYSGGSQTVTVPPGTPVTELKLSGKAPGAGDQLAVLVSKRSDGSLSSSKAISTAK